jgi:two-component system sensor histidine kinase BaeS
MTAAAERLRLVVHELRSPVAALTALAEQAAAGAIPVTALATVAALAAAAGSDIERLLADPELLSVHRQPVDLRAALAVLARPRVTVTGDAIVVRCDPTRVRQAVGNLVANGLRHGTSVAVGIGRAGGSAEVVVADDGPGVPAGFDPFALGVSRAGSSGFGLWLARAIAEAHGGRLELDAGAVGPGAVFRLCLPLSGDGRG